jgi:hypothetical protein
MPSQEKSFGASKSVAFTSSVLVAQGVPALLSPTGSIAVP